MPTKGIRGQRTTGEDYSTAHLAVVGVHTPNTRDVGIIHMPLQCIPPGKSLHTTSNRQSTLEHIRSSLDTLLVCHALPDALSVQVSLVDPNSAAYPLIRLLPTIVGYDMALEIWNTMVPLLIVASDGRAQEVGFLVDEQGSVFALKIARGNVTPVGVIASCTARRGAAFR